MLNYDDTDTAAVSADEWAENWAARFEDLLSRGRQVKRACAVDAVVVDGNDNILLVRRKFAPYKGYLVLPGGFVDPDETTEQAVIREVKEETGIDVIVDELSGVYSDPERDPRQNISIAYFCDYSGGDLTDSEETEAIWMPILDLSVGDLGFDHDKVIENALCIHLQ